MAKDADVRARVPDELKQQAMAVLAAKDYTMSEGINAFLQAVVEKNGIPFPVERKPSSMLSARLKRSNAKFAQWDKKYNNGEDL